MTDNLFIILLSIISNLSVTISVFLLWLQVREMKKQVQSSTYQTIVQMFDNFSQIMLQYPQLFRLIFNVDRNIDQIRAEWAVFLRFDWFESIVIQKHKYQSIPEDIYNHWMNILEYELSVPFIRNIWEQYGNLYHPLLQQEVQRRLSNSSEISLKETF